MFSHKQDWTQYTDLSKIIYFKNSERSLGNSGVKYRQYRNWFRYQIFISIPDGIETGIDTKFLFRYQVSKSIDS